MNLQTERPNLSMAPCCKMVVSTALCPFTNTSALGSQGVTVTTPSV